MNFPLLTQELEDEFLLRVSKVRLAMEKYRLDAVLLASTVNIFYMTGGVCRGYFYLPVDREPLFFVIPPAVAAGAIEVSIRKPEQIAELLAARGI